MEGRFLHKNCSVVHPDGQITRSQAVLIDGPMVLKVEADERLPGLPGDWVVGCRRRLVLPGSIELEPSMFSALAGRGQPTPAELTAIAAHALGLDLRRGV